MQWPTIAANRAATSCGWSACPRSALVAASGIAARSVTVAARWSGVTLIPTTWPALAFTRRFVAGRPIVAGPCVAAMGWLSSRRKPSARSEALISVTVDGLRPLARASSAREATPFSRTRLRRSVRFMSRISSRLPVRIRPVLLITSGRRRLGGRPALGRRPQINLLPSPNELTHRSVARRWVGVKGCCESILEAGRRSRIRPRRAARAGAAGRDPAGARAPVPWPRGANRRFAAPALPHPVAIAGRDPRNRVK